MCGMYKGSLQILQMWELFQLLLWILKSSQLPPAFNRCSIIGPVCHHTYVKSFGTLLHNLFIELCVLFRFMSWSPTAIFFTSATYDFLFCQHVCRTSMKAAPSEQILYTKTFTKSQHKLLSHVWTSQTDFNDSCAWSWLSCIPQLDNSILMAFARQEIRRKGKRRSQGRRWGASYKRSSVLLSLLPECSPTTALWLLITFAFCLDLAFIPWFVDIVWVILN